MLASRINRTGFDEVPNRATNSPPTIMTPLSAPQITPHACTDIIDSA
ncbi:Uncharacterised protein [Nocardia farcinica]|nr:Uncharacterised protein [Nocardia farcinica]